MVRQLTLLGQPVAPGIALGPAFLLRRERKNILPASIEDGQVEAELERLDLAMERTRLDLRYNRRKATRTLGDIVARIFDAHLMIMDDEPTFDSIRDMIRSERITAEYALYRTFEAIARSFDAQKEDLFRDRAQDVRDVGRRLLAHLTGAVTDTIGDIDKPSILIAAELNPSDILQMDPEMILGVATDAGGATSHTAILTRTLGVPSVVGLHEITTAAEVGDLVVINGNSGKVMLRPTPKQEAKYREKETHYRAYQATLRDIRSRQAVTLDGHRIELAANIELPDEARRVLEVGGDGVGLFRTEYLVMAHGGLPSEDVQETEYRRVAKTLQDRPVIIRTFDLGGDKAFPGIGLKPESNPNLGWRAIRVALDRPEMMIPQLRAILKASTSGKFRLMFPMIGCLEELFAAKKMLDQAKQELDSQGIAYSADIQVGMMIEVPSAALLAHLYAPHVDFFSIGTNDLVQFTLAVDRSNEQVAMLHQPFHPAVLRLIRTTVEAGHQAGIWVGLCGEFGGNPLATLLLVGLGLDELSLTPAMIPEIKKLILSSTRAEAVAIAEEALACSTASEVRNLLLGRMKKRFKDMPIWFGDY